MPASAVARLVAEQDGFEAAESHARDVERLIDVLRTREREGEGSRFDRLRAEQELRDARQRVTAAARRASPKPGRASPRCCRPTRRSAASPDPLDATVRRRARDTLIARATSTRAELRALAAMPVNERILRPTPLGGLDYQLPPSLAA